MQQGRLDHVGGRIAQPARHAQRMGLVLPREAQEERLLGRVEAVQGRVQAVQLRPQVVNDLADAAQHLR